MMLEAFRDAPLLTSPDGLRGGYFVSVEAQVVCQNAGTNRYELKTNALAEDDVKDWAGQKGRFAIPSQGFKPVELEGAIRILFVQPESGFRATIPDVLVSSSILDPLQLPPSTFATFQLAGGTFSMHTIPEGSPIDDCERLSIVFRSPQKWECTVGGLAISHDFRTGVTTALNIGYAFDLDQFSNCAPSQPPAFASFIARLQEHRCMWIHPLFLPNLFLITHVLRVGNFIMQDLDRQVIRIEYCIGVTKSGRSNKPHLDFPDDEKRAEQQKLYVGDQLQRHNARTLTEDINDLTTTLEFTKRSPSWDNRFAAFLSKILVSSARLEGYRGISALGVRETLEYVENYSEGLCDWVQNSHARMQLQLNILYTSIAQDDGQTSARLAASAGKDSTSMKIIALITAAYLPGTFVATLLSMGMFNWKFGQDSDVSKDFWIYWAVTIPLTIVTLSGWALWWKFEEKRFERDVRKAARQQTSSSPPQNAFRALKSHVIGIVEK